MLACKLSTRLEQVALLFSGGSNAKLSGSFDTLLMTLNKLLCMGVTAITKGVTTITKGVTVIRNGVTANYQGGNY